MNNDTYENIEAKFYWLPPEVIGRLAAETEYLLAQGNTMDDLVINMNAGPLHVVSTKAQKSSPPVEQRPAQAVAEKEWQPAESTPESEKEKEPPPPKRGRGRPKKVRVQEESPSPAQT